MHSGFENTTYKDHQGRQTQPNSGGFAVVTKIDATIPASIFKKIHFLPYLRNAIKKGLFLDFYAKKSFTFTIST